MFKRANVEVDGRQYTVWFDAHTGEPSSIDVKVRNCASLRRAWTKNKGKPPSAQQILVIQAARDVLEFA
ncbi:Uncharacterised protein [Burkholderia pseudomallei]|uniref:hypothetical protein n=1 Tax=Burkholderia pseudomallei TaxID=28450 RepID=UPI000AD1202C|nr:hypothetical protein [Burkholderia pseudomallei]MBD2919379.1 hypothetical protein [Burkholderia pseudomallei]MBD2998480.1 hypothetical protein [Burkholderia pseudomallei]MCW0128328.1 hypothetical protein [Burkholderia pseudomallei]NAX52079.1 hypothetical protein [Burkholderia pseudomallei]NAX71325.1 hypothetical protein [Burkholderia pseudomallei]